MKGRNRISTNQWECGVKPPITMNWCVKRGFLDVATVPPMTFKTRPRERVLSDRELAFVRSRAEGFGNPYGPIVQLLILTDQRKGEVVGLRRSLITGAKLAYPPEFMKNQRSHTVPVGKLALLIACSRHSSDTGTPPSARRRIARIWGSLYLVIFIKISSCILAEKIRIPHPHSFRGDCPSKLEFLTSIGPS